MRVKDFMKLSVGEYEVYDGIYTYTMVKGLNADESPYYRITEKGGFKYVYVSEKSDNVLSATSSIGGIFINGDFETDRFESIRKI